MLYTVELTIPPNTELNTYVSNRVHMLPGTITEIDIRFPPGCSGLARVAIFEKEHILWPTPGDVWFYADTFPITFTEDYVIREDPFTLEVRGYNIDNLYEHTVLVMINVLVGEQGWTKYLTNILGGKKVV